MSTASKNFPSVSPPTPFKWTPEKYNAVMWLADGYTWQETANEVGVDKRTICNWMQNPEFSAELDEFTVMFTLASKAERVRVMKRIIRQKINEDGTYQTKADLIDWMKLLKDEIGSLSLGLAEKPANYPTVETLAPTPPVNSPPLDPEADSTNSESVN